MLFVLDEVHGSPEIVAASGLVAYTLVLGAGVSVYFHWRIAASRGAAWLTVALLIGAAHGLMQSAPLFTGMEPASASGWPLMVQVAGVLVLATAALLVERFDLRGDPALIGVTIGLALTSVWLLVEVQAEPVEATPALVTGLSALIFVGGLVIAWRLQHLRRCSPWVRRRLAVATVALIVAECAGNLVYDSRALELLAVSANLVGAIVVCTMVLALLRQSVLDYQRALAAMNETLTEFRTEVQHDRERLHEIGSTIAGIASASAIMNTPGQLPTPRRDRLEEMLAAEIARLQRLMETRVPSAPRPFAVDAVVRPLVESHRARGRIVHWHPSGHVAVGQPDALAEVVNILLENAAVHGRGAAVDIEAIANDGHVEISVHDGGPGISREVRATLFGSGVRGPDSAGQGLGLAIARKLMAQQGGSLVLLDSPPPSPTPPAPPGHPTGASFVARLPERTMTLGTLNHTSQ